MRCVVCAYTSTFLYAARTHVWRALATVEDLSTRKRQERAVKMEREGSDLSQAMAQVPRASTKKKKESKGADRMSKVVRNGRKDQED